MIDNPTCLHLLISPEFQFNSNPIQFNPIQLNSCPIQFYSIPIQLNSNSIPTNVTLITNTYVFSFLLPPRCCQQQPQNNNGAAVTAIMPFLQSQTQSHGSNQSIESIVHDTQVFTRIGLFQVRTSFHWLLSFHSLSTVFHLALTSANFF